MIVSKPLALYVLLPPMSVSEISFPVTFCGGLAFPAVVREFWVLLG
jgi:hypothetical protein